MVKGEITKDDQPIIEVGLMFGSRIFRVKAMLDTGFNGSVCLPANLLMKSGWRELGHEQYELATGELVEFPTFLGEVLFDGRKEKVLALLTRAKEVLVGSKLLSGKLCELDYKTRKVRIRAGGVLR